MRILAAFCLVVSLGWIFAMLRWLEVDSGVVRFHNDATYLLLSGAGIVWFSVCLAVFLFADNEPPTRS